MEHFQRIDKGYYNKESAKRVVPWYDWVLYYIVSLDIFLDYQCWSPYLRLWHPASWPVMFISILFGGINGLCERLKNNKRPTIKNRNIRI